MSSTRYQQGTVARIKRAKGPDVWVFRYRETNQAGKRVACKRVIGDIIKYPTKVAATRAIENTRSEINAREQRLGEPTINDLWGHFQAHELHDTDVDRSRSTIDCYLVNFRAHIIPRWGECSLAEVRAPEVEKWLRSLAKAPGTKAKLRNQMSALYSHAIRHGMWKEVNPISSVRQSAKRQSIPVILSLDEMRSILNKLEDHQILWTAILVAALTGLRRSEINGLKWEDIDWEAEYLVPKRGWVGGKTTKMKTEASRKAVPVLKDLLNALQAWRDCSPYRADHEWVFASEQAGGRTPLWLGVALQDHVRPAALRAGVHKKIGWHTFRHSLATLLSTSGEKVKTVQALLRHANSNITLQLYQQADDGQKRAALKHTHALFAVA